MELTEKLVGGTGAVCAVARTSFCRSVRNVGLWVRNQPRFPPLGAASSSAVRVHFYGIACVGQERRLPGREDSEGARGQSVPATLDLFGQFSAVGAGNSVSAKCLGRRNSVLKQFVLKHAFPARARFKFGAGLLADMRFAADIPAGIAGGRGEIAAFSSGEDIPAVLREGSLGALGGQLDLARSVLKMNGMGVAVPLKVNGAGRYVLSAGPCGKEFKKSRRGPSHSVSFFERGAPMKRPDLRNGGSHFPFSEDGLYQFFTSRNSFGIGGCAIGGSAFLRPRENYHAAACESGTCLGPTVH